MQHPVASTARRRGMRAVACILLVAQGACSTTQILHSTAGMPVGATRAIVFTNDGSQTLVLLPRVHNDTLFGTTVYGEQAVLPSSDIKSVKVRTFSRSRTMLFGGAALVAVALGFAFINGGNGPLPPGQNIDCAKRPSQCQPAP
jgi:hypothetical protein